MKKVAILSIALLLAIFLTSCFVPVPTGTPQKVDPNSTSDTASTSEEQSSDISSEPKEQYFQIGDIVHINDWYVTVNSFSFEDKIKSSEYTAFKPDEGSVYLVLNITVKNVGTVANKFLPTISLEDTKIRLLYDNQYKFSSTNLLGYSEDLHDKFLNPLAEATGILAFEVVTEVRDSDKPLVLQLTDEGVLLNVEMR